MRTAGEDESAASEGAAAVASLSKVLLYTALVIAVGIGVLGQLHATRYLAPFVLSAAVVFVAGAVGGRVWRARPGRSLLLLTGLCAGFLVGWPVFFALGPELDELEGEGDGLVAQLEGYRAAHGRYPVSLDEGGCAPRWTRFGGWRYRTSDDGGGFSLAIGDYGADGFVFYREPGDTDWHWDQ